MSKKYKYKPNTGLDDSYVIAEFVSVMDKLERAHKCPVRLVKTVGCGGLRYAIMNCLNHKRPTNE